MNQDDAEAFTEALGQVLGGGWRLTLQAERLGVPEALGMTLQDWQQRVGGYVRMSVEERREAVRELTEVEGLSGRKAAQVLGVDPETVRRDSVANAAPEPHNEPALWDEPAANAAPDPEVLAEEREVRDWRTTYSEVFEPLWRIATAHGSDRDLSPWLSALDQYGPERVLTSPTFAPSRQMVEGVRHFLTLVEAHLEGDR